MKRIILCILSVGLSLSVFVSCEWADPLTLEEAQEGYEEFLTLIEDEHVFEDHCILNDAGNGLLVLNQGDRSYYSLSKEEIEEIDELFDQAVEFLRFLQTHEDYTVTGGRWFASKTYFYRVKIESEQPLFYDYLHIEFEGEYDMVTIRMSNSENEEHFIEMFLYFSEEMEEVLLEDLLQLHLD